MQYWLLLVGITSYVKAGSVPPSLPIGLLFLGVGCLACFWAYQLSQHPGTVWIALATSRALAGIWGTGESTILGKLCL